MCVYIYIYNNISIYKPNEIKSGHGEYSQGKKNDIVIIQPTVWIVLPSIDKWIASCKENKEITEMIWLRRSDKLIIC